VAIAVIAMVCGVYSAGTIEDPDVFWHILIGDQILQDRSLSGLGADWTVAQPEQQWQTSQWLSEVLVSLLHDAGGLPALIIARTIVALLLFLGIGALLLARATPRAAVIVMPLVALAVAPTVQDRPQTASLVLTVWLAWRISGLLRGDRGPSVWEVGAVTLVWAQFHGLWIIAPAAFAVLTLGRLLEGRASFTAARRAALLTLACVVGGVINPLGPKSLILPLTFAGDTALIDEWSRTSLSYFGTVLLLLLLMVTAVLWSRSRASVPVPEVVHIAAWTLFAFLALRNIAPAMLLMAPVVAGRLSGLLPASGPSPRREQRLLTAALALVIALGSAVAIGRALTIDPLAGAPAAALAADLTRLDEPVRVLNDYNSSGIMLYQAGDKITLGIDGRADRLGGAYTEKYSQAQDLRGAWRAYVDDINPDVALLLTDTALTTWLTEVDGWVLVRTDGDFSLLARTPTTAESLK
jgi:hypothetical protein